MFTIGMKICILNDDGEPDYGTIIFIEPDFDINLDWLYVKSDVDSMNDKQDPKLGSFWRLIESTSDRIYLDN